MSSARALLRVNGPSSPPSSLPLISPARPLPRPSPVLAALLAGDPPPLWISCTPAPYGFDSPISSFKLESPWACATASFASLVSSFERALTAAARVSAV